MMDDQEQSGYNKSRVEQFGRTISECYANLSNELMDNLQERIKEIGTNWSAPEAVNEFKYIKDCVDTLYSDITNAYSSFNTWVRNTGKDWATKTGGQPPSIDDLPATITGKSIDVTCITEEKDGNIYMHENNVRRSVELMFELKSKLNSMVQEQQALVSGHGAFFGHNQGTEIAKCFNKISDAINSLFNVLTNFKNDLEEFIESYKKLASSIATSYSEARVTTNTQANGGR